MTPLPPTIAWQGGVDGWLELLDQTRLPAAVAVLRIHDVDGVVDAIARLAVRGAPAIGVAAAYGLVLGARGLPVRAPDWQVELRAIADRLAACRPTAVNLRWALDRCQAAVVDRPELPALLAAARQLHADEAAASARIGRFGAPLVPPGGTVLTHCNTGRLATAGEGTALAVLFAAARAGASFRVLAGETRPLLQGARLTALELAAAGIPVEVIADSAAAGLIAGGAVQLVLVGADRIAANGDVANKVGTYGLALACAAHAVPFHVAAPCSTFDPALADGTAMPIEERPAAEVLHCADRRVVPPGVGARNPAFDVTPAALVTGFVTDRGLLAPPFRPAIKALQAAGR